MRETDLVRLRHMADAAREALGFAVGRTRTDLDADRMLVLALIKDVEILGEAANQISEAGRATIPDIPWANVVAMRNRLVHAYHDINYDVLWSTVAEDLPPLVAILDREIGSRRPG